MDSQDHLRNPGNPMMAMANSSSRKRNMNEIESIHTEYPRKLARGNQLLLGGPHETSKGMATDKSHGIISTPVHSSYVDPALCRPLIMGVDHKQGGAFQQPYRNAVCSKVQPASDCTGHEPSSYMNDCPTAAEFEGDDGAYNALRLTPMGEPQYYRTSFRDTSHPNQEFNQRQRVEFHQSSSHQPIIFPLMTPIYASNDVAIFPSGEAPHSIYDPFLTQPAGQQDLNYVLRAPQLQDHPPYNQTVPLCDFGEPSNFTSSYPQQLMASSDPFVGSDSNFYDGVPLQLRPNMHNSFGNYVGTTSRAGQEQGEGSDLTTNFKETILGRREESEFENVEDYISNPSLTENERMEPEGTAKIVAEIARSETPPPHKKIIPTARMMQEEVVVAASTKSPVSAEVEAEFKSTPLPSMVLRYVLELPEYEDMDANTRENVLKIVEKAFAFAATASGTEEKREVQERQM